ncbi:MAG: T9SS type A sorting domain-containing protein [Candidatus Hatepunaea meridiana]|nr:T9SS type A sorting domain-containing protein [Candidatus Hatepunaea meridiana]
MKNKFFLAFILLSFILPLEASGRDYWGLRNINTRMQDSVYVGFDADYYCFAVSWARTELQDDEFTWNALDNSLNFAERFDGTAVLVVSCNNGWATDGQIRAPNDLDRRNPLSDEPPENGYSESLYDFAYQLVTHIAERENPVARYLRFVNEPEYNWVISRNWEQDVEDYVRCLRTFYIAAHDAAEENEIEILVSHGGFNLVRSLARKYYRLGEENEELQDSLTTLLQSRFERHSTRIRSWEDVSRLVEGRGGMPPNYWTDVIAGQTEWLDWFDIHYHFKPRFIFDELTSFEEVVQDSGGELRPWLAAEAAMQLAQGGLTDYEERFHAGDMARKWILGMAFGLEGICTPITGYPPEHFFGLFDDEQEEYLSATAYRFLRSIIEPLHEPELNSIDQVFCGRFDHDIYYVVIFWYDALFDSDNEWDQQIGLLNPRECSSTLVYNILGELLEEIVEDEEAYFDVTQEPIIVIRYLRESVDNDSIHNTPDGFQLVSVYPNPFNARTKISFSLNRSCPATVTVYDLYGRQVDFLFNGIAKAGVNQLTWNAGEHPSGIYFVRMISPYGNLGFKVLLVR